MSKQFLMPFKFLMWLLLYPLVSVLSVGNSKSVLLILPQRTENSFLLPLGLLFSRLKAPNAPTGSCCSSTLASPFWTPTASLRCGATTQFSLTSIIESNQLISRSAFFWANNFFILKCHLKSHGRNLFLNHINYYSAFFLSCLKYTGDAKKSLVMNGINYTDLNTHF